MFLCLSKHREQSYQYTQSNWEKVKHEQYSFLVWFLKSVLALANDRSLINLA